ncbi:sensor histidine kinase [Catelliglobosispora koreensis]|uniref:sensor histidine kinase n=1 Tax=Catelliglobosispora koreensis TaxID=129052 RepID=UPI0003AA6BEF|nr:sensor histidine kinase [Catelliglobosispora koreensis]
MSKRSGKPSNGFLSRLRRPFGRLRDMPIWAKLGLIMIPPVLATLVIGTNGLVDNLDTYTGADRIRVLSQLVKESGTLVDALQNERAGAVQTLAADNEDQRKAPRAAFEEAGRAVDAAALEYTQQRNALRDADPGMRDLLTRIDNSLSRLQTVRQQVGELKVKLSDVSPPYQVLIRDLLEIRDRAAQSAGSGDLGDGLRAAAAIAAGKEFLAEERIVVLRAFDAGEMTPEINKSFLSALVGQDQTYRAFESVALSTDVDYYKSAVTGPPLRKSTSYQGKIESLGGGAPITTDFSAAEWDLAMKDHANQVRNVEKYLDAKVETAALAVRNDVTSRILIQSSLVGLMLIVAILSAWLVARSMARSLRELRQGALTIAQYGLPQAVARLRDPALSSQLSPAQVANQIAEPLPVRSKDEFGQVTEAFNAVHLEAVRTAAEQAALRSSVATMFVNLARRSQILVDRLIGHLDRLERGEEDPDRLAELFQLDHLATRMRRNDENLLVLAGADSTRVQREPAALLDVLRAAQSEVEHYTRIEFGVVDRDIEVAAHAVNDLVHLIAELFDNATAFSPPDSSVMVEARRVGDRAVLYVEDHGIGIQPDMLADINERLATPPMVDVAVSRMMGLVVVARLAARHGVKVELRSSAERGVIADVTLPTAVLVPRALSGRAGAPSREPSAIEPQRQPAVPPRNTFGAPLALESGSPRGFDAPTPNPFAAPPAVTPPPMPAPVPAPPSRAGMPAWSDLTGAGSNEGGANDPLPRRTVDAELAAGGRPASFYGSQIPRQTPPEEHAYDRLAPYSAPPASSLPISAVPVSAVPVSSPPRHEVPMGAAPPIWPPVAEERPSQSQQPVVPQHIPYADETMELPIFRELESAWFSTRRTAVDDGGTSTPEYGAPDLTITAQFPAVGSRTNGGTPVGGANGEAPSTRDEMVTAQAGAGRMGQGEGVPAAYRPTWQTAADAGWAAATAAASVNEEPEETTMAGLPKRTPMAQLVPGGVDKATTSVQRRSPEGVRGLLSAYHRGVQRGRTQHKDDQNPGSTEAGGQNGKEHEG